jgi:hypothetical protein
MRHRLIPMLLAGLLVLAACGDDGSSVGTDGRTSPTAIPTTVTPTTVTPVTDQPGPDDLVASVRYDGGFTTPQNIFTRTPILAVYGDGRVMTVGAQIAVYPAPSLTPLQIGKVTSAQVISIIEAAKTAKLDRNVDYGHTNVADDVDTVVQVLIDGVTFEHRAYSLHVNGDMADEMLTDEQRSDREALAKFIELAQSIGEKVTGQQLYTPERYRLHVARSQAVVSGTQPSDPAMVSVVPWMVDGVTLAATDCLAVEGASAAAVREQFSKTNELTQFSQGIDVWEVWIRPVLPHEPTCPTS